MSERTMSGDAMPDAAKVIGGDPISRFVATMVDRVIRALPILSRFRKFAETIARFAGVGALSSLIFAIIVVVAVSGFHLHHDLAALLGFLLTMPLNFLLHRYFTFHSTGMMQGDAVRYVSMQACNITLTLVSMSASVDALGLPYGVGIVAAIFVVPVVTYLVMDQWVFREKAI